MAEQRIGRELIQRPDGDRMARLARGEAPKLRDIYDDTLTGLRVSMRPNGSVSFVYRWSAPEGQQKRSIGRWPVLTVEEALAAEKAFTWRTDHKFDTLPTRVTTDERRMADARHCAMPTLGSHLDGDYPTFWLGTTRVRRLSRT